MKYIDVPGLGRFEYANDVSDFAIRQDVMKKIMEFQPEPTPLPVAEPEEAGFFSNLGEGLTNLLDLPEAIEYGIKDTDTARETLIKAGESDRAQQSFDDITNVGDFWKWTKQLAGTSLGQMIPAGVASAGVAGFAGAGPIGAGLAASSVFLLNFITNNMSRQAQENQVRINAGEEPEEASLVKATAAAIPQAAADYFVVGKVFKPIGKLIGLQGYKVAGDTAQEIAKKAAKTAEDGIAKKLTIGAGKGVAAEVPQELSQTVLERAQAGLSLTDESARKEYFETTVGAAVLGAPIGVTSSLIGQIQQRETPPTDQDPEQLPPPDEPEAPVGTPPTLDPNAPRGAQGEFFQEPQVVQGELFPDTGRDARGFTPTDRSEAALLNTAKEIIEVSEKGVTGDQRPNSAQRVNEVLRAFGIGTTAPVLNEDGTPVIENNKIKTKKMTDSQKIKAIKAKVQEIETRPPPDIDTTVDAPVAPVTELTPEEQAQQQELDLQPPPAPRVEDVETGPEGQLPLDLRSPPEQLGLPTDFPPVDPPTDAPTDAPVVDTPIIEEPVAEGPITEQQSKQLRQQLKQAQRQPRLELGEITETQVENYFREDAKLAERGGTPKNAERNKDFKAGKIQNIFAVPPEQARNIFEKLNTKFINEDVATVRKALNLTPNSKNLQRPLPEIRKIITTKAVRDALPNASDVQINKVVTELKNKVAPSLTYINKRLGELAQKVSKTQKQTQAEKKEETQLRKIKKQLEAEAKKKEADKQKKIKEEAAKKKFEAYKKLLPANQKDGFNRLIDDLRTNNNLVAGKGVTDSMRAYIEALRKELNMENVSIILLNPTKELPAKFEKFTDKTKRDKITEILIKKYGIYRDSALSYSKVSKFFSGKEINGKAGSNSDFIDTRGRPIYALMVNDEILQRKSSAKLVNTMSHELGHILMWSRFNNASSNTRRAVYEAYHRWRKKLGFTKGLTAAAGQNPMWLDNYLGLRGIDGVEDILNAPENYKDAEVVEFFESSLAKDKDYWVGFDEWFADNVAKYATTQKKPLGIVEKFFKGVADDLRKLAQKFVEFTTGREYVETTDYLPDPEVKKFIETTLKDTNFENSGADATTTGAALSEAAGVIETTENITKEYNDTPTKYGGELGGVVRGFVRGARRLWLRASPVQAIADVWESRLPPLRALYNSIYKLEGDTRSKIADAKEVINKLEDYKGKNRTNSQYQNLSNLMYGSTYANVNVVKIIDGTQKPPTDINKQEVERLKRLYQRLDAEGQALYKEVGEYYSKQYDDLIKGLRTKMKETKMGKKEQETLLSKVFNFQAKLNYYFPLKRRGEFWVEFEVDTVDADGKPTFEIVEKAFKTEQESRAFADFIENKAKEPNSKIRQHSDEEVGGVVKSFRSTGNLMADGKKLDLKQVAEIEKAVKKAILDNKEIDPTEKNALQKAIVDELAAVYVASSPEKSVLRSLLVARKNVAGAEGDIVDVFAESALSMGRQSARLENSKGIDKAMIDLEALLKTSKITNAKDQVALSDVMEMIKLNVQEIKNPRVGFTADLGALGEHNIINTVGKAGFLYYLATPAAAVVNIFQTPTVAASMIAGKHGFTQSYGAIKSAGLDVLRGGLKRKLVTLEITDVNTKKKIKVQERLPAGLSKDETIALANAYRTGVIDRTMAGTEAGVDPEGLTQSELAGRKFVSGPISFIVNLFSKAERLNREVTFLAAYRLGKRNLDKLKTSNPNDRATYADPFSYATDMTNRSHGDYSHGNSGLLFKSPYTKSIMMFKKFPVLMYYNYFDTYKRWRKGKSPEERQEAKKQLFGMLGTGFMAGGLYGLPAYFAAEWILGSLFNAFSDDERDADVSEMIREMVGETVYKGPLQAAFGVEIATRVGLGAAPIHPPRASKEGENAVFGLMEMIGGPALAIALNTTDAMQRVARGENFARSVEGAMPLGVRNIMKGIRFYDEETATTRSGLALVDDLSKFQIAMQVLGFTPAELSRQYDLNNARLKLSKESNSLRLKLLTRAKLQVLADDQEELKKTLKKIEAFNKNHPEVSPIRPSSIMKSARMTQRYKFVNDELKLGGLRLDSKRIGFIDAAINPDED